MKHTSLIEISQKAVENNIRFIRKRLHKKVILSSVVKGNAYGHGIEQYVPIAKKAGVTHFSVFSTHEARRVKQVVGSEATILLMGYVEDDDLEWVLSNDVELFVFEFDRLTAVYEMAQKLSVQAKVHIEIETGMNRTGFEAHDFDELFDFLKKYKEHIVVQGLCTHLAGAENIANHTRIESQIKKYHQYHEVFCESGFEPKIKHIACSAAFINYPETHMDMVRIGILQYGFWPSMETFVMQSQVKKMFNKDPLKRAISWKSYIMTIKEVKAGEYVSYGTSYLASKKTRIAIVPVGYAYGFSRTLSNHGRVLIHGKRTAVIGMVNMNCMIVDATDIPNVTKGDEVVLIGTQKKRSITVSSFSEMSNQMNYELLTRLPMHIPRYIVD